MKPLIKPPATLAVAMAASVAVLQGRQRGGLST
jgi:hypothetical protein